MKNTPVTGGSNVYNLRGDRLPPLPTRTSVMYGKDADYTWVMMDWSKEYRELIKGTFNWTTYPIITKLDYQSGDETSSVALTNYKQGCFQPKSSILTMWNTSPPATL